MGLTSWKGAVVRKGDVTVAKNYLREDEIDELNRIVVMFLISPRIRPGDASRFSARLEDTAGRFLRFNDRRAPRCRPSSRENADQKATAAYERFAARRRARIEADAEAEAQNQLEEVVKKLPRPKKPKRTKSHERSRNQSREYDPALKAAGWGVVEGSRIRREYPITLGRLEGQGRRGKPLTADYVLVYRDTKLAVVEAKAWYEALTEGVAQAKNYAGKLAIRFTYAANGQGVYGIDMQAGTEGELPFFPSPEELWSLTFAEEERLAGPLRRRPLQHKTTGLSRLRAVSLCERRG